MALSLKPNRLAIIGGACTAVATNLYSRLSQHIKSNVIISCYPDAPRHSVSPEDCYKTIKSLCLEMKHGLDIQHFAYLCNTGHIHRERLMQETGQFMFDMITPTKQAIKSLTKNGKIGILSSTLTQQSGLYESKEDYQLITPSKHLQMEIQKILVQVGGMPNVHLNMEYDQYVNRVMHEALTEMMNNDGVDSVIVGCTDISYYFDVTSRPFKQEDYGINIVDSQNVLIEDIINWHKFQ